jgi:hypothetical protein
MDVYNSGRPSALIRRGDHRKRPVTLHSYLQLLELLRANHHDLSHMSDDRTRFASAAVGPPTGRSHRAIPLA